MRQTPSILLPVLLLVLVVAQALALAAQDKEKELHRSLSFGYRAVDTERRGYNKYREHINLDKGIRLFNFSLSYIAREAA